MEVKERIAYVRGLIEGSEAFERDAATRSVWENLLRVCDDLAESVSSLESAQDEVERYVEAIDVDLCDLEEIVYGDGYEPDEEDDEDEEGEEAAGGGEGDEDDEHVRAECPRCGEEVFFEESLLYDEHVEISCPNCGEVLYRGEDFEPVVGDEDGPEDAAVDHTLTAREEPNESR